MISQTAEYALRATIYLAEQGGAPRTIRTIASATRVPTPYLYKALQNLVSCGLIASQRGLHGGFSLNVAPERLTVYDIVQAVDPPARGQRCPLHPSSQARDRCPLQRLLDDAMARVQQTFRDTCIADLLTTSAFGASTFEKETTDDKPIFRPALGS